MNRKYALVALVVLAAAGVALFLLTSSGSDDTSTAFSAYAPDSTETPARGDLAKNDVNPEKGATKKQIARVAKPVEDTLNRPGPDPTKQQQERHIKNRRPRDLLPSEPKTGSLSKQDIRQGLDAATPFVKECYHKTLAEFPDAAGKVTVGFRIIGEGGEGHVEMTELDGENTTLFDQKLHDCLQERVAEAAFPAPTDGAVHVRFPFVFSTDNKE